MMMDKAKISVCPSCQYKYRVPDDLFGRRVFCKSCGTEFKLDLQEEIKREEDAGQSIPGLQEEIERISPDDCLKEEAI